ncbi:MAG: carboxypeptidase-like regulatory domain-containing protein [Terriglobia bacterium]
MSTIILLAGICSPPQLLWGQSAANSGEIVGQVLDQSGGSVAGAKVTVQNENTNLVRSTTTDDAGRYAVSLLPLGPYAVTTKASGFGPETQEVLVTLGSSISAVFHLTVKARTEAIQVTALTTEPTQASSKTVLTDLQIQEVPSNGGRLQNLIWEIPGGQIEPE